MFAARGVRAQSVLKENLCATKLQGKIRYRFGSSTFSSGFVRCARASSPTPLQVEQSAVRAFLLLPFDCHRASSPSM